MQIDELIIAFLTSEATDREERELLKWRRASPENEFYYREFVRTWELAAGGDAPLAPGPPPTVEEVVRAATAPVGSAAWAPGTHRETDWRSWFLRGSVAAALVLFGFALSRFAPGGGSSPRGFGANEIVTGMSETATVTLRDGTVVRLAPRSRLRLVDRVEAREVALEGRAYFAVAREELRPFRILTAAGTVETRGTRFDLQTDAEDLQLIMIEGRVAVTAGGREVEVAAGELTRVLSGTLVPAERVPDAMAMVDWTGRFLAFQATPLRQAALEIARAYRVRIEVTDSALAERTVTTWFADRSLEEVLRIVCGVVVAECSQRDDLVTMKPLPSRFGLEP